MSLSLSVLGSGSRGNCSVLALGPREQTRFMLIDCGLSMKMTKARLAPFGIQLDQITDILVTHLDTDHFQPAWVNRIKRLDIKVHLHRRHRAHALRLGLDGRQLEIFAEPFDLDEHTSIEPILLAHDNVGTAGFVIEHRGCRLGWATDLGRVPDGLFGRFVNLDAVAIESNYDREMELSSKRPLFLKQRIMGGAGHLSNEQSLDAVLAIDAQSQLQHVITLHLSQQCNDPRLVKRLYAQRAGHLLDRLTISNQHQATPALRIRSGERAAELETARPGEQIAMF